MSTERGSTSKPGSSGMSITAAYGSDDFKYEIYLSLLHVMNLNYQIGLVTRSPLFQYQNHGGKHNALAHQLFRDLVLLSGTEIKLF